MTAPAAYKPGKEGTVTDILMNKNIGIDGKTRMLIDERVARVREDNPQIGDIVEYKQLAQGPDKGKISFFTIKHRAADKGAVPAVPAEEPEQKAPPREPTTISGKYIDKTSKTITIHDGKENRVIRADLDLIVYLSGKDNKVHEGDSVTVRLIDNNGLWVAKDIGPGPEGFKTGKEILQENLDSAKQAAPAVEEKAPVQQIVPEKEAEELKARGEAANMEKIRKDAEAHQEKLKAEIAAKKSAEPSPSDPVKVPASFVKSENPPILNPVREEPPETGEPSEGEMIAPIEVGVHIDMGGYTNFDLKLADISGDRVRKRIEDDSMKMIGVMRRLMTAAKKGY
jgi:hypothetical protein